MALAPSPESSLEVFGDLEIQHKTSSFMVHARGEEVALHFPTIMQAIAVGWSLRKVVGMVSILSQLPFPKASLQVGKKRRTFAQARLNSEGLQFTLTPKRFFAPSEVE